MEKRAREQTRWRWKRDHSMRNAAKENALLSSGCQYEDLINRRITKTVESSGWIAAGAPVEGEDTPIIVAVSRSEVRAS